MTKWNGIERSPIRANPDALPLAREVQIRRESPKRAAENRVRRKVLAEMRQEDPMCAMGCGRSGVDGHELLARSAGGSITNPANIKLLCRPHHDWITHDVEGQRWAYANGWRISRYAR